MQTDRSTGIRIEPATRQDVPVLLALVKELAEYEHLSHELKATEESVTASLFEDESPVRALVIRHEDVPAGYCFYFLNYSTFLARPGIYIEDIYVRPPFRRIGIGRAVFSYLARTARERNYGRLDFAVLDWNQPAIDFYQSLGARHLADWQLYRFEGEALALLAGEK